MRVLDGGDWQRERCQDVKEKKGNTGELDVCYLDQQQKKRERKKEPRQKRRDKPQVCFLKTCEENKRGRWLVRKMGNVVGFYLLRCMHIANFLALG